MITAFAPGRVNLIGEHTDYTGGLVLPMALTMGVTVSGSPGGGRLKLTSSQQAEPLDVPWSNTGESSPVDLASIKPTWGRYLAAVAAAVGLEDGFEGTIESTLPAGGTGLSSSSALTVAALLALAGERDRNELAQLARDIEADATGVRSGIMDQLSSVCGVDKHALLIDCRTLDVTPTQLPDDLNVLVVHSGQPRILADSEYNERRASCEQLEAMIGPLRDATISDLAEVKDERLRRRGRHVISENGRVLAMVDALADGDVSLAGELLAEGHRSLADDYEVSTPIVDAQAAKLSAIPGVYGARLTGGGFGGSLVAFAEPGVEFNGDEWWVRAVAGPGASVTVND